MRQDTRPANQAISVGSAAQSDGSFDCTHLLHKTVQVYGTWVGTLHIMGTLDGTNWFQVAGSTGVLTANGIVYVPESVVAIAIKFTAYTSGTASAVMSGFNAQTI